MWMRTSSITDYETRKAQYRKARKKVKTFLWKAKRKFHRNIARAAKSNPRAFYGHTRRHLKTKLRVAPLLSNVADEEKASILLTQLSSVYTQEQPCEIPCIENRSRNRISGIEETTEMVLIALLRINVYKSCGPGKLHPRLLKELAEIIASPIAALFRCSLERWVLPEEWKQAFVTPIYKKGSHNLPENYRPISLTFILWKTMEIFVRDHIVSHLQEESQSFQYSSAQKVDREIRGIWHIGHDLRLG